MSDVKTPKKTAKKKIVKIVSQKDSVNELLMGKFGKVILPTTIKGQLTSSWYAFNKFSPIELGTSMLLYGASQSGKSIIMMKLGAAVQRMGGLFVCFNAEAANRDIPFLKRAVPELNYPDIAFYQPDSLEYTFDCISLIIDNAEIDGPPVFLAVDSISSCATKHELSTTMEKSSMEGARIAMLMASGLRQVTSRLSKKPIVLCLISQERESIGMFVSKKKKSTGGSAPRFYASTTLYTRGHNILYRDPNSEEFVAKAASPSQPADGRECSLELQKSRFSSGGNRMTYIIDYTNGINKYDGLYDILDYEGYITQEEGWCTYKKEKFRKKNFIQFVETHPELLDLIR